MNFPVEVYCDHSLVSHKISSIKNYWRKKTSWHLNWAGNRLPSNYHSITRALVHCLVQYANCAYLLIGWFRISRKFISRFEVTRPSHLTIMDRLTNVSFVCEAFVFWKKAQRLINETSPGTVIRFGAHTLRYHWDRFSLVFCFRVLFSWFQGRRSRIVCDVYANQSNGQCTHTHQMAEDKKSSRGGRRIRLVI